MVGMRRSDDIANGSVSLRKAIAGFRSLPTRDGACVIPPAISRHSDKTLRLSGAQMPLLPDKYERYPLDLGSAGNGPDLSI